MNIKDWSSKFSPVTLLLNAAILILFIIFIFRKTPSTNSVIIRIDTITKYITIHDTIRGKTIFIKGKSDTLWVNKPEYIPDTNYSSLLTQYIKLGNVFFTRNMFETTFPISTYGTIRIRDSVTMNKLISSIIIQDLKIPNTTIIKTISAPPTRQLYVGGSLFGNPTTLINGINAGIIYKDKKDRMFGIGIGWNNGMQYSLSNYWKIKFK